MSRPLGSAVAASSTTMSVPFHGSVVPGRSGRREVAHLGDREVAFGEQARITVPTWPVAPTTPTRTPFPALFMAKRLTAPCACRHGDVSGRRGSDMSLTARGAAGGARDGTITCDGPARAVDPVAIGRAVERTAGERRRRRARDGLGLQQRDRIRPDARAVRGDRRRRGAGVPHRVRPARAGERAPDARRDRLRHRSDDVRVHPRVRHRDRLRSRRRASSSGPTRRSAGSARSSACARAMSPTARRSICPTTRPMSHSATSRCSTATPTTRST